MDIQKVKKWGKMKIILFEKNKNIKKKNEKLQKKSSQKNKSQEIELLFEQLLES